MRRERLRYLAAPAASIMAAALFVVWASALAFAAQPVGAGHGKMGAVLAGKLAKAPPGEKLIIWVRFADRPFHGDAAAAARWAKHHHGLPPVNEDYISAVAHTPEVKHRVVDELTNQISIELPARAVAAVSKLPFVTLLEEVDQGRNNWSVDSHSCTGDHKWTFWNNGVQKTDSIEKSMQTINIANLHNGAGNNKYNGSGIKIGIVDSGIQRNHECFDVGVLMTSDGFSKIQKEYDNTGGAGDNDDGNVNTADDEDGHGTACAGVAAGYSKSNNRYIGTAPDAKLAIAKFEYVKWDNATQKNITYIYSDLYVDAVKWLVNTAQVDIISSSVTWASAANDGSHVTSRWLDWAVKKGVVVCACAGNYFDGVPPADSVSAPGDLFNGITVGAMKCDDSGIASYSRKGRTADKRLKPDVVAPGGENTGSYVDTDYVLAPYMTNQGKDWYAWYYGTSFATPMTAGVVACMMEKDNTLKGNPLIVRTRLWETAVDKGVAGPDTTYGFGRVDANAAANNAKPQLMIRDEEKGVDWGTVTDVGYIPSCDAGGNGSFNNERNVNVNYPVPNGIYEGMENGDDPFWVSPSIFVDNEANGGDNQPDNPNQPLSGQINTFKVRVHNIGDGNATANQIQVKLYTADPSTGTFQNWTLQDTQLASADIAAGGSGLVSLTWNTPAWNTLGQAHWCIGATVEYLASVDDKAPAPGVNPSGAIPKFDVLKSDNFAMRNFWVIQHLSAVELAFRVFNTTDVSGPVMLQVVPTSELPSGWTAAVSPDVFPMVPAGGEAYPSPYLTISTTTSPPVGTRSKVHVQARGPTGEVMGGLSVNTYVRGTGPIGMLNVAPGPNNPMDHLWQPNPDQYNEMMQMIVMAPMEPVRIKSITLAASGSGDDLDDITNVKLWVDVNNDGMVESQFPGDTLIATGTYNRDDGIVRLSPAGGYLVSQGPPVFLLISYTMSGSGNPGDTYKFQLTQIDATGVLSGGNATVMPLPLPSCTKMRGPVSNLSMTASRGAFSPPDHWGFPEQQNVILQLRLTGDPKGLATLDGITLTGSGSGDDATDISAVEIYADNNNNGILDGADTLLGIGGYDMDNGVAIIGLIDLAPTQVSAQGLSLLVVYDVSGAASSGDTFVCSATGISAADAGGLPVIVAGLSIASSTKTIGILTAGAGWKLGRWQQEPDGTLVTLSGVRVSAGAYVFLGNKVYVEEGDRSHGIMLDFANKGVYVHEGDLADVTGVLASDPVSRERYLAQPTVTVLETGGFAPLDWTKPVAMNNRDLAGFDYFSYKRGASLGQGLNSVGLLATTFGWTSTGGSDYFMLSDGSARPVRVYYSDTVCHVVPPPPSTFVAVTGLVGLVKETPSNNLVPALRPRWQSDIVPYPVP